MNAHRCNHPDTLALTADQARWAVNHLRYWEHIGYPRLDPARIAANYARACSLISAVCGMTFEPVVSRDNADVEAFSAPIDGPWNVLAMSELPTGPEFNGFLRQQFDVAEVLDDQTMVTMMAHELGHILGLGHLAPGNLMAPVLDPTINSPQPGDIAELVARYGPPAVPTAPPSSPLPPAPDASVPAAGGSPSIAIEIPGVGTLTLGSIGFVPAPTS